MLHTGRAMDYIGIVSIAGPIQLISTYLSKIGQIPTADEYLRIKAFGYIFRKLRKTGPIMRFTMKQIRSHIPKGDQLRPDFLTRFLQAREKYPELVSDRRLATYTNTNVSAGSDTTAIALREAVYRVLTHPGSYDKVMTELAAVLAKRSEEGYDKPITWSEEARSCFFKGKLRPIFGSYYSKREMADSNAQYVSSGLDIRHRN